MENLIEIEKYLAGRLKGRIEEERDRILAKRESYGTEVWDIIMEVYMDEEKEGSKLQGYITRFKEANGENEAMWYDEFSEEMIFRGMSYALKICIIGYIQENAGDFEGLVILPLRTPENNIADFKCKAVIYNTKTEECYANVVVPEYGQEQERWELNECFSSYIDFLRYV